MIIGSVDKTAETQENTFLLHFEFISHIIIIMCLREKEKGSEGYEVEEI